MGLSIGFHGDPDFFFPFRHLNSIKGNTRRLFHTRKLVSVEAEEKKFQKSGQWLPSAFAVVSALILPLPRDAGHSWALARRVSCPLIVFSLLYVLRGPARHHVWESEQGDCSHPPQQCH